jgi:dGTPase
LLTTQERITNAGVSSVELVKALPEPLVIQEMTSQPGMLCELRVFLVEKVYHHPSVYNMTLRGREIVHGLFQAYQKNPSLMPVFHAEHAAKGRKLQVVGDYVAGMTDRLAEHEYYELYQ